MPSRSSSGDASVDSGRRRREALTAPTDPVRFGELHSALARFTELTNDPANQIVHRLEPGQLLVFDNHRMLHGRTPFELGQGGRRHLLGNHLDRDDLSSRVRALRRRLVETGTIG